MENLSNYIDIKSILTEIIKVVFTGIVGLITFRIYQRYKNKSFNNNLFVYLLRLESEFVEQSNKIKNIVSLKNKFEELKKKFLIDSNSEFHKIYEKTKGFWNYTNEELIYEYGEVVDVEYIFTDRMHDRIKDYHDEIEYLKACVGTDYEENIEYQIDNLESLVDELESKSLLEEIEESLEMLRKLSIPRGHKSEMIYLRSALERFEKLSEEQKYEKLDVFCNYLVNDQNVFSSTLREYAEMCSLKKKIRRPRKISNSRKKINLSFEKWRDEVYNEMIAEYDVDKYIVLDRLYKSISDIHVYPWDLEKCQSLLNGELRILENELSDLKKNLGKSIKFTSKVFKNI